jgi:putative methionine-R-sulfoxide reductase with GAF domain
MVEDQILPILGRITRTLASEKPFDTTLKLVAREIARLLRANQCAIMLLDDRGQELLFKQSYGLTREELEQIRFRLGEGLAGWVVREKTPARVDDVSKDPRFKPFRLQKSKIASILCVPLVAEDLAVGVISLSSPNHAAFSPSDQAVLEHLAHHTAREIQIHRQYELSVTDPVTHLYNEAWFHRKFQSEIDRAWRFRDPLGLCVISVPEDSVAEAAREIRTLLRKSDLFARQDDGFLTILFPDTDRESLVRIAGRIRAATPGVRMGLSAYPDDGADGDELLGNARAGLENEIGGVGGA